ncbi:MAG: CAP domain-containing protein [Candidatus Micrarchaeota archaeon]|nr:CAP domain-containing protein [Candidatus Micrarchaeota archaeon]
MGKRTGSVLAALVIVILIAGFALLFKGVLLGALYGNTVSIYTTTINQTTTSIPEASTTVPQSGSVNGSMSLDAYALSLINNDRNQYGLPNVTLAGTQSGQQHSNSMLSNNYFSHWDIFGMKPYMRYTLLGGVGAVDENVAYQENSACVLSFCHGDINVSQSLKQMEYSMMYNDSQCCNNGHRDNILDPHHNQVSIGIAYNSSTVYFTEDFIDSYITWSGNAPAYSDGNVYLSGSLSNGYSLSSVQISYDPVVQNMTRYQLNHTSSYGYGQAVGGVVRSSNYYYQNITTIVASRYSASGDQFNIVFSMQNLTKQYGAGEYTVMTWLNDSKGNSFIGATYTIFMDSSGQQITPAGV